MTGYSPREMDKLLHEFDRDARIIRPVLHEYFLEENIDAMVLAARNEFEGLIPQLPDIGGKQPFSGFLVSTAKLLSLYRVTSARSLALEEIGNLVFKVDLGYLKGYPAFLTRTLGGMNFSQSYLRKLRKRSEESQKRAYPDDFVYQFVEGDGINFDYGVDYLECANCKFLQKQGASEFAPYICPADILYSKALGWGLTRTTTLAEGGERCDFRFKRNGEIRVAVPASLRELVEKTM